DRQNGASLGRRPASPHAGRAVLREIKGPELFPSLGGPPHRNDPTWGNEPLHEIGGWVSGVYLAERKNLKPPWRLWRSGAICHNPKPPPIGVGTVARFIEARIVFSAHDLCL